MPGFQFTIDAGPVLLPFWVAAVIVSVAALRHHGLLSPGRTLTVITGLSYLTALAARTLFPLHIALGAAGNRAAWYEKLNWIPVLTIDTTGFVLNVIMFVPLGLLLPLAFPVRSWRQMAAAGLGASMIIEGLQLLGNLMFSAGRTADVNDLIANTAGAVLGWLLLQQLRRLPGGRRATGRLALRPALAS